MKKSNLFFALFLLTCTYSFVNFPSSVPNPLKEYPVRDTDDVPSYKIETATNVFNNLKRSLGILSSEKPKLSLRSKLPNPKLRMAMITYADNAIYLEEKAYDLCTTFGKDSLNALAVYLGHELAHLVGKHNITNHYAWTHEKNIKQDSFFMKLEQSLPKSQKDSLLKIIKVSLRYFTSTENEKDADLSGGFIAYLAGYQTFGITPKLLDKTYNNFPIPKTSNSYPSLEERKQIAIESEEKLKALIDLFEMGNLLVALDEFDDALLYYQKVLKEFKSREIYNNIGVLYTLSFLKKASKQRVKYAFPIELDANSRLNNPGTKGNQDNEKQKLLSAIENFEKASNLDPDYPIAHLNKSCAHALLGIHADDEDLASEEYAIAAAEALIAKRLAKANMDRWKKTLTDTYTQNGIIEALKGNNEQANILFKKALTMTPKNHLAVVNQNILNEIDEDKPLGFGDGACAKKEIVDETPIEKINISGKDIKDILYQNDDGSMRLAIKQLDHSKLMTNYVLEGGKDRFSSFHLTDADYNNSSALGIKINNRFEDIKDTYGEPDTYFELGQGSWLIYNDCNIIFQLDTDGKLVRWSIFNHKL